MTQPTLLDVPRCPLRILALDPATHTGWAHSCGASGTWDCSIRRDESAGMRLLRLRGKLNEAHQSLGIDLVAFEAARNAAPKMQGALVIQAQLQAIIVTFCEDHGIQYRGFSPSEVKKHATGKGNASKEQMIAAAKALCPSVNIADDNQADALHILSLMFDALGKPGEPEVPEGGTGGTGGEGRRKTDGMFDSQAGLRAAITAAMK